MYYDIQLRRLWHVILLHDYYMYYDNMLCTLFYSDGVRTGYYVSLDSVLNKFKESLSSNWYTYCIM